MYSNIAYAKLNDIPKAFDWMKAVKTKYEVPVLVQLAEG